MPCLPLLKEIDELNNDNDLFMRAMNLAELAEKNRDSSAVVVAPLSSAKMATVTRTPRGQNKNVVFDILKSIYYFVLLKFLTYTTLF